MANDDKIVTFKYNFSISSGEEVEHIVEIDRASIHSEFDDEQELPDWAKLDYKRCDNCKLPDTEYCPVAARLAEPIDKFQHFKSHLDAKVTVIAKERSYSKETNIQDGLRSLFGLIMATSGCPAMEPLRPMALYHLPFSTLDETIYRVVSMYLLRCFVHDKSQDFVPVAVQELDEMYENISIINMAMTKRLSGFVENDSTLNAVVGLDALRYMVPVKMDKTLESLEKVFN